MNIKTWPDSALSKKCQEVQSFDERLINILEELKDILTSENALGLAANQLGFTDRLFIIKLKNGEILEVINPEILEKTGEQYQNEACLSFPGIVVKIKRPKVIHFSYNDRNGEKKEAVVYDLEAIEWIHEFDHLNGVTLLDHLNRQERKRILKELK